MKVLGISDACDLYTGFGTQTLVVLKGLLKKGIEVEQLGWFKQETIMHQGIQIHPMGDKYGDLDKVIYHCNRFKPDIIWSLGDLHMVQYMFDAPEEIKKRWIHWLPIDAQPYPYMMHDSLAAVPNLVLMSQFAADMCKEPLPNAKMIPHGLDASVFRPLQNKHLIKLKNNIPDKFVVLTVMRNQWRKNLDLAVEAFARFSRDKDDVIFIMHTQPAAPPSLRGWIIPNLCKLNMDEFDPELMGVKNGRETIKPPKIKISAEQLHESKMNFQYNVADVFLLTSGGEGFGIPTVEAQMAGVPVLVPDSTTGPEFVLPDGLEENRTGELIDIAINQIQGDAGVKRALISPKDAANKLEKFYQSWKTDKALLNKYGENGRRTSTRKYNFQVVIDTWHKTLVDLQARINAGYVSQGLTETAVFDVDKPMMLEEL